MRGVAFWSVIGPVVVITVAACGSDPPADECITVNRSCTPAYEPSFDNVFQKTLKPSCALPGSSCHAAAGHQGGLVMEDIETAHNLLLEHKRAIAGNPECSLVVRKTQSTDRAFQMPPGLPLSAEEQCSILQWVAQGAKR